MAVQAERDYDRQLHQATSPGNSRNITGTPATHKLIPNISGMSSNDNGLAYTCHIL